MIDKEIQDWIGDSILEELHGEIRLLLREINSLDEAKCAIEKLIRDRFEEIEFIENKIKKLQSN